MSGLTGSNPITSSVKSKPPEEIGGFFYAFNLLVSDKHQAKT